MTSIRAALVLALVTAAATGQSPTCPGSGLTVAGGVFGDGWSLSLAGPPSAAALLASDAMPGPVFTPYGPVCLGMSQALVTTPLTLDAAGQFSTSGILPLASAIPAGSTLFVQAALAHPSLPGGIALTNGAAVTVRPPRVGLFRSYSTQTASVTLINPVNDTVALVLTTPPWGSNTVHRIPRLEWFGWTTWSGFYCVDSAGGANVLTIPDVQGTVEVSEDGARLFSLTFGTGQIPAPLLLKTWSLPSGSLVSTATIPVSGFVDRGIYPIPGTSTVYVGDADRFHVVDTASGAWVTTIPLPGMLSGPAWQSTPPAPAYAFFSQGLLYAVAGTAIVGIDPVAHAIVAGPTQLVASSVVPLTVGPGSGGPALWAVRWNPNYFMLSKISLPGFNVVDVAPLATWAERATLSAGGTEMILQQTPGLGGTVVIVNVATNAIATIPGLGEVGVLRSDTLRKAYAHLAVNAAVSFQTDPYIGGGALIPIPPSYPLFVPPTSQFLSN
jgi:hypothetical protein